tara:strand:+ start:4297 stop:4521 length:225 start_codon:yes stop_codon:yes gene_type:complete
LPLVITVLALTLISAKYYIVSTFKMTFGVKSVYSSIILKVSVDCSSGSEDLFGFYIGAFAEFNLSEKFSMQPEL